MEKDIRWVQRFHNYRKALTRLTDAIQLSKERRLSDLEQQGLIQAFEFTYELAWKTLQDLLIEKKGLPKGPGPNQTITWALEEGYISGEDQWDEMKEGRKRTAHAYDEQMATEIAYIIVRKFHGMFIQLETRLQVEKLNREKDR